MDKKHALFISIFVTLIVAGNYLFFNAETLFPEKEIVFVTRVLDGDTLEIEDGRKIRLVNINTPEKGHFVSDESFDFLKSIENKNVELKTQGIDRYGRTLGKIFYSQDYVNLQIIELGLAHIFLVKDSELSDFLDSQERARNSEIGIWKKSEYFGCLGVEINKKDEFVSLKDNCDINLKGWTIKDESTRDYEFKKDVGEEFILYSGKGEDSEKELYWERGNVWNNDKDSIFIRDKEGLLVFYNNYGY